MRTTAPRDACVIRDKHFNCRRANVASEWQSTSADNRNCYVNSQQALSSTIERRRALHQQHRRSSCNPIMLMSVLTERHPGTASARCGRAGRGLTADAEMRRLDQTGDSISSPRSPASRLSPACRQSYRCRRGRPAWLDEFVFSAIILIAFYLCV